MSGRDSINEKAGEVTPRQSHGTNTKSCSQNSTNVRVCQVPPVHPDLRRGLRDGRKHVWLQMHRREIEAYVDTFGMDAARIRFNSKNGTLERLLDSKRRNFKIERLSYGDKWLKRYCDTGDAELRKRINDLEDFQERAAPFLAMGENFIKAAVGQVESKDGKRAAMKIVNSLTNSDGKLKI